MSLSWQPYQGAHAQTHTMPTNTSVIARLGVHSPVPQNILREEHRLTHTTEDKTILSGPLDECEERLLGVLDFAIGFAKQQGRLLH